MLVPVLVQETDAVGQSWERGPGEAGPAWLEGRPPHCVLPAESASSPRVLGPGRDLASSGEKQPQGQGDLQALP